MPLIRIMKCTQTFMAIYFHDLELWFKLIFVAPLIRVNRCDLCCDLALLCWLVAQHVCWLGVKSGSSWPDLWVFEWLIDSRISQNFRKWLNFTHKTDFIFCQTEDSKSESTRPTFSSQWVNCFINKTCKNNYYNCYLKWWVFMRDELSAMIARIPTINLLWLYGYIYIYIYIHR